MAQLIAKSVLDQIVQEFDHAKWITQIFNDRIKDRVRPGEEEAFWKEWMLGENGIEYFVEIITESHLGWAERQKFRTATILASMQMFYPELEPDKTIVEDSDWDSSVSYKDQKAAIWAWRIEKKIIVDKAKKAYEEWLELKQQKKPQGEKEKNA